MYCELCGTHVLPQADYACPRCDTPTGMTTYRPDAAPGDNALTYVLLCCLGAAGGVLLALFLT